jgi:hypothetical protein
MAYQATILNVMIASPNDVSEERQLVRDAIYEWNAIHSKQFGVMLNPVGWETHVGPEMGGRPQEIINKRILEDSDILLGIFWTRLGTETGEYVSGTVEEISRHIASQKLTSIYICDRPIPPSKITDQYQKLQVQIREWMPNGVLEFYNDLLTLKQKIKDHITLQLQNNEYIHNLLDNSSFENEVPSSNKHSIEPSDEMVQILLNAGKNNDDIQFIRTMGGVLFNVGNLNMHLTEGRELAKWQHTIENLVSYGLLKDRGYKNELFYLTNDGWNAFDQLNTQLEENQ